MIPLLSSYANFVVPRGEGKRKEDDVFHFFEGGRGWMHGVGDD